MAAWIWIVIAIGVLVFLALVAFGAMRGREKRQRREQASELRQEAETRTRQAEERERVAQEQVRQARDSRKAADEASAHADELDPDGATTPDEESFPDRRSA
jgi:flagellar biosynthesis/type III secretory pathway M-ring protein FliF/YscJ